MTDAIALIASVVSVALGIIAVFLSHHYYRLSDDASARLRNQSEEIRRQMGELNALYWAFHSDAWGTIRTALGDMTAAVMRADSPFRAHGVAETRGARERALAELKQDATNDVAELTRGLGVTDERIKAIEQRMALLVEMAASQSETIAGQRPLADLEKAILDEVRSDDETAARVTALELVTRLFPAYTAGQVLERVWALARDGAVVLSPPVATPELILPTSAIASKKGR